MIKIAALSISGIIYLWNVYLDFRQFIKIGDPKIPKALKGFVKQDVFDKSRNYSRDKSITKFFSDIYQFIISGFLIWKDGYAYFWDLSIQTLEMGNFKPTEIKISLVFILIYSIFSLIAKLPFSLYSTFVVEEKHGFNKQSLGLFFSDMVKGLVLGVLIGGPVLSGMIYIVKATGRDFYFYLWLFMLLVQFILIMIYPTVIQPLFNKFTPLEDGELKNGINSLAKKIDFPLTKIFV